MPTPYDTRQEIYIALIPSDDYIEEGIWTLRLVPIRIRSGYYNAWLPVAGATNAQTGFLKPTLELSLTIPSTSYRAVTVGAYDSRTDSYAAFSGRGFSGIPSASTITGNGNTGLYAQKPDLVAPGVNITSAAPGGGYDTRSGTSMATPFVTGAAALLMQWGILEGNDPYLYGEKLKASLIRGTTTLSGFNEYPNSQVGWGALCVQNSLE
jgi:subtilisin family serine protease